MTRFADRKQWNQLDDTALSELREHVAGLPNQQESGHISARLFGLLCVSMQVALVKATADFTGYRDKLIGMAMELETRDAIPAVKQQIELIQALQTEAFWEGITLPMIESIRRKVRGLVQFIERTPGNSVYTMLTDEIGESSEVKIDNFSTGINLAQYKRKVEAYIRANEHHMAIAKLRHNRPLTPTDLEELERFVYGAEVVGGREAFEKHYGNERPLTVFIRSLVGLDRTAAKEAFAAFLDDSRYSATQIRFVETIIDRLAHSGVIDPGQLYEPPFTAFHYEGVEGTFGDSDAEGIFGIIVEINQRAAA